MRYNPPVATLTDLERGIVIGVLAVAAERPLADEQSDEEAAVKVREVGHAGGSSVSCVSPSRKT